MVLVSLFCIEAGSLWFHSSLIGCKRYINKERLVEANKWDYKKGLNLFEFFFVFYTVKMLIDSQKITRDRQIINSNDIRHTRISIYASSVREKVSHGKNEGVKR